MLLLLYHAKKGFQLYLLWRSFEIYSFQLRTQLMLQATDHEYSIHIFEEQL